MYDGFLCTNIHILYVFVLLVSVTFFYRYYIFNQYSVSYTFLHTVSNMFLIEKIKEINFKVETK